MQHIYNDGGRREAGFRGKADDCVCRAIAIATGKPYTDIYERLAEGNASQSKRKNERIGRGTGRKTARHGIFTNREWFKNYMVELGFVWTATMKIGSGCKVHLRKDELPSGRLVCSVSKHMVAVIDGVQHDTDDNSREGTRCVYGYWRLES